MQNEDPKDQNLRIIAAIGLFGLMLIFFWFLPSLVRKSDEEIQRERWEQAQQQREQLEKVMRPSTRP